VNSEKSFVSQSVCSAVVDSYSRPRGRGRCYNLGHGFCDPGSSGPYRCARPPRHGAEGEKGRTFSPTYLSPVQSPISEIQPKNLSRRLVLSLLVRLPYSPRSRLLALLSTRTSALLTENFPGSSAVLHYAQQGPNLPGGGPSVRQGNNFKFAAGDFQGFGGYTAEGNANKEFANTNKENNELVDRRHHQGYVDDGSLRSLVPRVIACAGVSGNISTKIFRLRRRRSDRSKSLICMCGYLTIRL
jgi:hypothetical protein